MDPAARELEAWDCRRQRGCRGSWPEFEEGLAAGPDSALKGLLLEAEWELCPVACAITSLAPRFCL